MLQKSLMLHPLHTMVVVLRKEEEFNNLFRLRSNG
jgi:hypothetical protein